MSRIDGRKAMSSMLAAGIGLPEYAYIMTHLDKVDVSGNGEFQRRFNYFYKIRRNAAWREKYYRIFERHKVDRDVVSFENILCNIYVYTGMTEASFASKMLATLNPDKPIWDRRVLNYLGLMPRGNTESEKQDAAIRIYRQIEDWYGDYLATANAKENIEIFDDWLPDYSWISSVKKIDYILWGIG